MDPVSATGEWTGLELTAHQRRALTHPHQALTAARSPHGGRPAVVAYLHLELVAPVAKEHLGAGRLGVAKCVRQRFLDDPVGGQIDARGKQRRLSLSADHHLQTARAHGLGQLVDPLEPWLRRGPLGFLVRPYRAQQPPSSPRASRPVCSIERIAALA